MSPQKRIKYSTKWLGVILVTNAIIWINFLWYAAYQKGDLNVCSDITKFTLATGVILLLGRKAISEIIVKVFGNVIK